VFVGKDLVRPSFAEHAPRYNSVRTAIMVGGRSHSWTN
jgi:hypothetical protein